MKVDVPNSRKYRWIAMLSQAQKLFDGIRCADKEEIERMEFDEQQWTKREEGPRMGCLYEARQSENVRKSGSTYLGFD